MTDIEIKGPPPGGGFNNIHQAIVNAIIAPEAGAISISFKTLRPAKPIFTVWKDIAHRKNDMAPQNQIAAAFESLTPTTTHFKRITGLPQGVPLWLRIDAAAEDVPVGDPRQPASFVCETGTLTRTCEIQIASLELLNSGDSDGGASMVFMFQVYNGSSNEQEALTGGRRVEIGSIDNGLLVGEMEVKFTIDQAPDVVVPYLAALHMTLGLFQIPTHGTGLSPMLPNEPDVDSGVNDDFQSASSHTRVTLPFSVNTIFPLLNLGTDLKVPTIAATLAIATNFKNPAGIAVVTN